MSYYPTGMSPATANHYHNVAARMQSYMYNGGGQNLHHVHGQINRFQPSHGPVFGSQFFPNASQRVGFNPLMDDAFAAAGRNFMRHLLR